MDKQHILTDAHWQMEEYKQRITIKEWRFLLLNDDDKIIYKGRIRQLKSKNIGAGVVEVSKESIK